MTEQNTWEGKHMTQRKWQTLDAVSFNCSIEMTNFEIDLQRKNGNKTIQITYKLKSWLSSKDITGLKRMYWAQVTNPALKTVFTKKKWFSCFYCEGKRSREYE